MNMGGFDPFAVRMAGMNPNVAMQAAAAQMEEEELALAAAGGGGPGMMGSSFQQRADFLAAQEMRLREQERRIYLAGATGAGPASGGMSGITGYGNGEVSGVGRLGRGGMMQQPGMGAGMGLLGVEDGMMGMGGGVSSAMMARLQQQQQVTSQGGQSQFGKGS